MAGVRQGMESVRPLVCERARQWASERVDIDISEFEAMRLERHLARCTACAAFTAQLDAVVGRFRSAPIARLSSPVHFSVVRRPRQRALHFTAVGATLAVIVAAAVVGLVTAGPAPRGASYSDVGLSADNGRAELDSARLAAARANTAPPAPWPGHGPTTS